jgi:diguanylate cyclase (GGDEF)-like protein
MSGTWLCRDDMDRERLLDMERRIKPVRALTMGILAIALLGAGPWIGWWTLAPLVLAAVLFGIADRRLPHSERPEYVMFAAWAGVEVTIAIAVALSGAPATASLSWLAIPVVTLSARFSIRGVQLGVAIAIALVLAVGFAVDAQAMLDNPPLITAPVALVLAVAVLSTALMRSDLEHRGEAVIDPLTGMLNRKALVNRSSELAQQSEITGEPVGVILGDLDHFKGVNDSHGHVAGDAVLKDLAYMLRKRLRAFDLAYRIGGEEFLIMLPGATAAECVKLADTLRAAIASETLGDGLSLTMSFGVSASAPHTGFDYDRVFAAADRALSGQGAGPQPGLRGPGGGRPHRDLSRSCAARPSARSLTHPSGAGAAAAIRRAVPSAARQAPSRPTSAPS